MFKCGPSLFMSFSLFGAPGFCALAWFWVPCNHAKLCFHEFKNCGGISPSSVHDSAPHWISAAARQLTSGCKQTDLSEMLFKFRSVKIISGKCAHVPELFRSASWWEGEGGMNRREKSDRAAAPGELSALQQLQCCCGLGHSLSAQRAAMERVFRA